HHRPQRLQAISASGPATAVTSRSGGTRPDPASTSRAACSSASKPAAGGGPSSTLTTQSEQAGPRTRQLSQSMWTFIATSRGRRGKNRTPPTLAGGTDTPAPSAPGEYGHECCGLHHPRPGPAYVGPEREVGGDDQNWSPRRLGGDQFADHVVGDHADRAEQHPYAPGRGDGGARGGVG